MNTIKTKLGKVNNLQTKSYSIGIHNKVSQALVSHAYGQSNLGLVIGLICSSVIWLRLYNVNTVSYIATIWLLIVYSVTVLRAILINLYLYCRPKKNLNLWRHLFVLGSSLGGLCWGGVAFVFLNHIPASDQVLVLMILAGITAGALPFISGILPAAFAFLTTALLPLVFYFLTPHPYVDFLMAFIATIYLGFLILQTVRINQMLGTSLLFQYELEEAKELLEKTATHDPLTQTANRIMFNIKFVEAIEQAEKFNKLLGLLYLDLNKFKIINDTYGHLVGDKILIIFTQRLNQIFKEEDVVARVGGDEFTVLLKDLNQPSDIEGIITRIHQAMAAPTVIDDLRFDVSVSIGSSLYPQDGTDPEALLLVADSDMYRNKQALYHPSHTGE